MSSMTGLRCPQCRRPVSWEGNAFRPFCSERCRLIDLGAWVEESYRIPDKQLDQVSDDGENIQ